MALPALTYCGPRNGGNFEQHWSGAYLEAHLISDVGKKRAANEDACAVAEGPAGEEGGAEEVLFAVADGMGGARGGGKASQMALGTIAETCFAQADGKNAPARLQACLEEANQRILAFADENPELTGMGTTVSAALVSGDYAYIAQVGDSRVYWIRPGMKAIHQITEDHSIVAEQVRSGLISPEEARTHALRNLITRAVGTRDTIAVDLFAVKLALGDKLLICTDGLTNQVDENTIARQILSLPPCEAAHNLVDAALAAGAPDNVTAVILEVTAPPPKSRLDRGAIEVDAGDSEAPTVFGRLRRLLSGKRDGDDGPANDA